MILVAVLVALQVTCSTSQQLECAPGQEIVCPTNETFAWCVYTQHQDRCPAELYCDPSLSYICSEDPPPQSPPPAATPPTDIPSDDSPPPEFECDEGVVWNDQATPPSICTRPGRFQDASDCSKFHVCLDGGLNLTHLQVECPQGSHFSARLSKCVEPERARCSPRFQGFECPDIGPVQDPEDCTAFRICHPDGTWRQYQCPKGSNFDPNRSRCSTDASLVNCEYKKPEKFHCPARGLYPDGVNCRKFYYCIPLEDGSFAQGEAKCPRDSVFNPETKKCTVDLTVCRDVEKFCRSRRPGRYPAMEGCSSFFWCGPDGASQEYTCPYGSNFDATSGMCKYESRSQQCETQHSLCKHEGRFPDIDNDCVGFFVCVSSHQRWKVQRYQCPDDTKFDYAKGRCRPKEKTLGCHQAAVFL
ncbi:uncharacterized protein LOC135945648 [Cloeon dipterum]|uniref:uncharacterized protein LOC135945648 n=1 Tax=Cloeon dipterum TaxID=197152 RepID=UPI00321F62A9